LVYTNITVAIKSNIPYHLIPILNTYINIYIYINKYHIKSGTQTMYNYE
jgi:hypothetical protein